MATKFEGSVMRINMKDSKLFFHIDENQLLQLLDADFNVIDNEINSYGDDTKVIYINIFCNKTKKSYPVQIGINPYGYYSSYVTFQCQSIPKLTKHYNLCLKKYDYKHIDNYFCKIPKDNMIFWQDNKDNQNKYIQMYLLLEDLHDTRTIIFSNILTYQRLDTNTYPIKK